MTKCPVCEEEHTSHICPVCQFDGSCNYEIYPTLQALSAPVLAVCGRKEALARRQPDFVIEEHILKEYTGEAEILTIPEGVLEIRKDAFANTGRLPWLRFRKVSQKSVTLPFWDAAT